MKNRSLPPMMRPASLMLSKRWRCSFRVSSERPVPVMDVEIDDRHARRAGCLLGTCSDRNVVEQTKAHCAVGRRMVARWTHEREAIVRGRLDCRPGGEERGLVARLGGRSVWI